MVANQFQQLGFDEVVDRSMDAFPFHVCPKQGLAFHNGTPAARHEALMRCYALRLGLAGEELEAFVARVPSGFLMLVPRTVPDPWEAFRREFDARVG